MTMHYRKTRKVYMKHNAADKTKAGCTLCYENNKPRIIDENSTMYVIPNRVPYDIFEQRKVTHHLMVIPKRHVESLGTLTKAEKLDYVEITGKYEAKGYNIYSRGVKSLSRSVAHLHTHMIELEARRPHLLIYSTKPHFLIHR